MSLTTDASDGNGNTQAKYVARPKTHPNLSIVYIDHELDSPIAESADDETDIDTSRPNLTVVYTDHHLDGPVPSDNSQDFDGSNLFASQGAMVQNHQGLFRLPPELRIMVWELPLPGQRLVLARAWCGRDEIRRLSTTEIKGHQSRWFFRVHDWVYGRSEYNELQPEIPTVLQICRESRSVAFRHGSFIFGQQDKSHETGMWWNPELDVLGFDQSWDLDLHPWALARLSGLEHVKRVAIDETQACYFFYEAGYNGRTPYETPRELREPLAVTLGFRESRVRDHYILEFFPHFQQLTIIFTNIYLKRGDEWFASQMRYCNEAFVPEGAYSVTFVVGSQIRKAARELRRYRKLCMRTQVQEPRNIDQYHLYIVGPVYSVKDNDNDLDSLDHWVISDFEACQYDQQTSI